VSGNEGFTDRLEAGGGTVTSPPADEAFPLGNVATSVSESSSSSTFTTAWVLGGFAFFRPFGARGLCAVSDTFRLLGTFPPADVLPTLADPVVTRGSLSTSMLSSQLIITLVILSDIAHLPSWSSSTTTALDVGLDVSVLRAILDLWEWRSARVGRRRFFLGPEFPRPNNSKQTRW
jgi:hypothetical protein